ncbi:hypothetical protein [Candidimonas nitroreducens]|uniref:Amidoligase enzyme n=1 Tax=Candidimonas nitroreducens TaxID=683354 RepID=A0A225M1P6_9BURK|nr:hypothetical protein [Candidimonas nitroreducens]OWT55247.1 hypothetical protein CEY11_21290 [Candidimonas nitroreducens]
MTTNSERSNDLDVDDMADEAVDEIHPLVSAQGANSFLEAMSAELPPDLERALRDVRVRANDIARIYRPQQREQIPDASPTVINSSIANARIIDTPNWAYEISPIHTTPAQAPVDAGHTQADTDRAYYEEQYARLGLRVLTDDEVVNRGAYVVWKDYDPAYTVITYPYPRAFSHGMARALAGQRPTAIYLGNKPLRVRATFSYNDGSGMAVRHLSARGDRQLGFRISSAGRQDSLGVGEYVMGMRTKTHMGVVPPVLRTKFIETLRRRHPSYATRCLPVSALSRREPPVRAEYRGQMYTDGLSFARDRALYKEVGQVIAAHDDDTIRDVLNNLSNLGLHQALSLAINAWNNLWPEELELCDCGHVEWVDEVTYTTDGHVCQECAEGYVETDDTSRYVSRDQAYYDEDAGRWLENRPPDAGTVLGYTTNVLEYLKPDTTVKVSPYGDILMGIELEVVATENPRSNAHDVGDSLCRGYAILKRDGSLPPGGFEIVTAPRSLQEHTKRFAEWSPPTGLISWDTDRCGMHVHLSSAGFSQAALGKFIQFINSADNARLIMEIAGRHPANNTNAQTYCRQDGQLILANPKMAVSCKSANRYRMVNTSNLPPPEVRRLGLNEGHGGGHDGRYIETVELRIFRGTLNKRRLLAQIEFAHAAAMFCRWTSMRELSRKHFIAWLRDNAGVYPHLARWFGVKANTTRIETTPAARLFAEI